MEEIYWLTRLDGINALLALSLIISIMTIIVSIIGYTMTKNYRYIDECWYKLWVKLLKYGFPTTFILSLLFVFTPTTKEAFAIWGVGGTIDYVQSNETIQQLPDKVVNALDVWVDSYTKTDSIEPPSS